MDLQKVLPERAQISFLRPNCYGRSALYYSSKTMVVLRNMSSSLEMVMHLLSVVAANGGFGCYRVGGAHGAQTR